MSHFTEDSQELSEISEVQRVAAKQLFQEAYELQMAGELDEAIECYQRSIELFPTAEAYTFLGWTYSFKGDVDRAIAECHRAIAVDPDFGNPYNDIGAYLIEKGDVVSAISWLRRAMQAKRYECYYYPHFNLGRIYEMQRRWLDALREFQKALDLYPGYTAAQKAIRRVQGKVN
ncbi:MAG: tetratricopeptide repeat protein [Blastocatellia bacterium]|nr:tetratricopeptide repeat protein [Blastocatellia bacterium]